MYKLSIAIMHTPDRPYLDQLLPSVPKARVITGAGTGLSDVWPTAKRAWMSFDASATHHLVLQDDLLPCKHFLQTIERLIYLKPEVCLGLYHNRIKADEEAKLYNTHWIKINGPAAAPALILPVAIIPHFLAWELRHVKPAYPHDDGRLCLWAYKTRAIESWFVTPTLVEHLAPNDSVLKQNNRNKVSGWFIGAHTSGLLIDWGRGVLSPVSTSIGTPSKHTMEAYIP